MTSGMKPLRITVLNDNTAGRYCLSEHGLSFFVETPVPYLFDTGFSDLFIENAQRLGVDLNRAETIILSHGHDDHTGGLRFLSYKTIVGHPALFMTRYRKSNQTSLGILFDQKSAEDQYHYRLKLTSEPLQLDERSWFLGEIPRATSFEALSTPFVNQHGQDDYVPDDSGMAVATEKGLVIISGCAHSGICNMIIRAQQITGIENVHAVIGGFHLVNDDDLTRQTIDFLKQLGVEKVMPSHCTLLPALTALYQAFGFIQVKSGNIILFQ